MITPSYFVSIFGILGAIILTPGIEAALTGVLIAMVIIICLATNAFFYWKGLRKFLFRGLLDEFYINLYKNDEYMEFLIEKYNARKK